MNIKISCSVNSTIFTGRMNLYLFYQANFLKIFFKLQCRGFILNNSLNNTTIRCKRLATIVNILSTILCQVKTGKHECRNTLLYVAVNMCTLFYVAVIFRHSCLPVFAWRRVAVRIFETLVSSLLHLMVILFKVLFNHASFFNRIPLRL